MSFASSTSVLNLVIERTPCGRQHKVRDVSQTYYGRLQIQLAESEILGLMACRAEFRTSQPLKGTRITGCLHVTTQIAVLIETLTTLGATVRWCSSDPFSTEEHVAATIARDSSSVFAWKGQSLQEYWWCVEQALDWGHEGGPHLLIDDGGDSAVFIHEGVRAEEEYKRCGKFYEQNNIINNKRTRVMFQFIKERIKVDPRRFRKIREYLVGISEDASSDALRLPQLQSKGSLLVPAININNSTLTSLIDNFYGMTSSLVGGLMKAIDHFSIGGKVAVICGYGDVGKGCVLGLMLAGAKVIVTEVDPICAMEALTLSYSSVHTLEDVVSEVDIFITATGNKNMIMIQHMKQMKNNAIVCNMGQFEDEIDFEGSPFIKRIPIKPLISDLFVFPQTNKGIIREKKSTSSGPSNLVRSCSYTNQVMAQLELWNNRISCKYDKKMYMLPRQVEEKVAKLHLAKLGAKLTVNKLIISMFQLKDHTKLVTKRYKSMVIDKISPCK
ncbi:LOW QUALITY PROTEIN: hypothetical protein V2J09_006867 [Rumex salicifolius]